MGDPRQLDGVGHFAPDEDVPEVSKTLASILDASWPETHRYTKKPTPDVPEDSALNLLPQRDDPSRSELFVGTWERDMLSALDDLDAAQVSPEERKRLSKDPGAAQLRAQLAEGPDDAGEVGAALRKHRGDPQATIAHFTRAIERNPGHPQPWTKRGIAHARLGKIDAAVEDYSRALEIDATYLPALANRGSARYHLDQMEGAAADCGAAIELEPKLAMAWLFRGMARAKLDQRDGANEDLYYFLRLTPYSPYVKLIRDTLKQRCNWDEDSDTGPVDADA